ncbi:MAG: PadR family transcriptional regulator [Candidatus Aenigmarchaeota archaeon]|nr:PadR family transcriptional regulator [Candidatus Aenigmarchaeota archaeon]
MSVDKHSGHIHSSLQFLPPTSEEIFGKSRIIGEIELGLLQMQVLWVLNRKPSHGYDIMKQMQILKTTKVTQGTLYPTLQRLVDLGLIKRHNQERKIVYTITDKGKKTMNDACTDFTRTFFGIFHDFVCGKCVHRDFVKEIGKGEEM